MAPFVSVVSLLPNFRPEVEQARWEAHYRVHRSRPFTHLGWVDWYYPFRRFDRRLRRYIEGRGYRSFLDLGVGPGHWLVYASRRLGLSVQGVDYAESACALARENLARAGVAAEIHHGNFLDDVVGKPADIVYLGGVIEHYPDPTDVLRAALRYVRPGGTLVNRLPTSLGLNRLYWKIFNARELAELVPLAAEDLTDAYRRIGLDNIDVFYNGAFCLSLFPKEHILPRPAWLHKPLVQVPVRAADVAISTLLIGLSGAGLEWEGRFHSPQVVGFGTLPATP